MVNTIEWICQADGMCMFNYVKNMNDVLNIKSKH